MPNVFRTLYPSTRCILDCTEILIEISTFYRSHSATFSKHKHHNTTKRLIGIAPSEFVTFVFELYTGRCSDKKITNDCGILNLLEPVDDFIVDRCYYDLPPRVKLNIPPLLRGNLQLELKD